MEHAAITPELVALLIKDQFPLWSGLAVQPVALDGWDNTTFRLGTDMSVRLPSDDEYSAQVDKEHCWLPVLAPQLPLPIPQPLAKGRPGEGFPRPWSVYRWLPGEPAATARIADVSRFAGDLAAFLTALYRIDPSEGPPPGDHCFHRGGSLTVYDAEAREAIATLDGVIDARLASEVWESALDATWQDPPVWVHGDVSAPNLLVVEGRLSAVIDFGCSSVGDPACDVVIAWTFLEGVSREVFQEGLALDEATWARGRGWALWKAAIVLVQALESDPDDARECVRVLSEVLGDHKASIRSRTKSQGETDRAGKAE